MTSKPLGRPASPEITQALVQAAERIMADEGYGRLTVDGITTEVGTSRPAFYRRYPSVAHLAFDVIQGRFHQSEVESMGSLEKDLLRLQRDDLAMFASPLLRNNLPGLLESVRSDESVREIYKTRFVEPRRENVKRLIQSAVDRGEVPRPTVSIEVINDVLVGPLLSRVLLPIDAPLDDQVARETTAIVMKMLNHEHEPVDALAVTTNHSGS